MRVVCYCRTSTAAQSAPNKVSIPVQKEWAVKFCKDNNYSFVKAYIDPGVRSDVELEDRPAMSELLDNAKWLNDPKRQFDLVLFYHTSRLSREQSQQSSFVVQMANKKIQCYFRNISTKILPPADFNRVENLSQEMLTSITGISDLQENIYRGEKSRLGHRGLAKRGKASVLPYGYKKIKGFNDNGDYSWHFELELDQSSIVQKIYDWYIDGSESLRSIQLKLNKDNVPSPGGKTWSRTAVRRVLSNPAYAGKVRYGKMLGSKYKEGKTESGAVRRVEADKENVIFRDGQHPAIISESMFEQAKARINKRAKIAKEKGGGVYKSKSVLTGLVRCKMCGAVAHLKHRTQTRELADGEAKDFTVHYFDCQTWYNLGPDACRRYIMSANKLETAVISKIKELVNEAKSRKELFYKEQKDNDKTLKNQIKALDKKLANAEKESKRLLDAYKAEVLTLEEFSNAKEKHSADQEKHRDQLTKFKQQLIDKQDQEESRKSFVKRLKEFEQFFKQADFRRKKDLLHSLIDSIVVAEDKSVKINFKVNLN